MPTFYIETEIGGTMLLKVEAPNLEKAMYIAEVRTIADWEDAGPLKFGDVRTTFYTERPTRSIDGSIVYLEDEENHLPNYDIAEDDPMYLEAE